MTIADIKASVTISHVQDKAKRIKAISKKANTLENVYERNHFSSMALLDRKLCAVVDVNFFGPNKNHKDGRTLGVAVNRRRLRKIVPSIRLLPRIGIR